MYFYKLNVLLSITFLGLQGAICVPSVEDIEDYDVIIPVVNNGWTVPSTDEFNSQSKVRIYFYVNSPGSYPLAVELQGMEEKIDVYIAFQGILNQYQLTDTTRLTINLGHLQVDTSGYQHVDISYPGHPGDKPDAIAKNILINTGGNSSNIQFIKNDAYFGRRGPSTHLIFEKADEIDSVEYFYSEIEIGEGEDVIGSYFMANGFTGGYFGIQVNSENERRILFSVWSPYKTDDPGSIPEEYRIKLLRKGKGVTTGEFGNEGSGGQSYKVHSWQSGIRYKFLLQGKPTGNNNTIYTAYFYDPELSEWLLIASFQRPKTDSYLKRLYSFLENFIPVTGNLSRQGGYFNQWVRDSRGKWHEITEARFSADQTARKGARLDYTGGSFKGGFYLKSCGFFNPTIEIDDSIKRNSGSIPPVIDFNALLKLQ
jgi:hypothetical protein